LNRLATAFFVFILGMIVSFSNQHKFHPGGRKGVK
jgi:hypothetical protein